MQKREIYCDKSQLKRELIIACASRYNRYIIQRWEKVKTIRERIKPGAITSGAATWKGLLQYDMIWRHIIGEGKVCFDISTAAISTLACLLESTTDVLSHEEALLVFVSVRLCKSLWQQGFVTCKGSTHPGRRRRTVYTPAQGISQMRAGKGIRRVPSFAATKVRIYLPHSL